MKNKFYLGRVDDFSQRPHQRAVHSHQLLSADLIRFVQHHAHFVLVVLQSSDHLGELVGDVQLVGVEQEDDAVHALCEPLQHRSEIITWRQKRRVRLIKERLLWRLIIFNCFEYQYTFEAHSDNNIWKFKNRDNDLIG